MKKQRGTSRFEEFVMEHDPQLHITAIRVWDVYYPQYLKGGFSIDVWIVSIGLIIVIPGLFLFGLDWLAFICLGFLIAFIIGFIATLYEISRLQPRKDEKL